MRRTECFGPPVTKDPDFVIQHCSSSDYSGDITFESVIWPSSSLSKPTRPIALGALQTVTGSLELNNIQIGDDAASSWTVNGSSLNYVSNNFSCFHLAEFAMPHFPNLSTSGGLVFNNVSLTPVPLDYEELWPLLLQVTTIDLTNTTLTTFGPFKTGLSPLGGAGDAYITVVDNLHLTDLDINGYNGSTDTVYVNIHSNTEDLVVSFPDMIAGVFNISGVDGLHAPAITTLGSQEFDTSEVQVISSNGFSTLDFPILATTYGTVEIDSNPSLTTLDLGNLTTVTSLSITNNTSLRKIVLPELQYISTSLYIDGPIDQFVARILLFPQNANTVLVFLHRKLKAFWGTLPSIRLVHSIALRSTSRKPMVHLRAKMFRHHLVAADIIRAIQMDLDLEMDIRTGLMVAAASPQAQRPA